MANIHATPVPHLHTVSQHLFDAQTRSEFCEGNRITDTPWTSASTLPAQLRRMFLCARLRKSRKAMSAMSLKSMSVS